MHLQLGKTDPSFKFWQSLRNESKARHGVSIRNRYTDTEETKERTMRRLGFVQDVTWVVGPNSSRREELREEEEAQKRGGVARSGRGGR